MSGRGPPSRPAERRLADLKPLTHRRPDHLIAQPSNAGIADRPTQQRHAKCLHSILHECNTEWVRIEWSDEFDHWFAKLEQRVDAGDILAGKAYNYIAAAFDLLRRLSQAPDIENGTAQLKPVRQSRR